MSTGRTSMPALSMLGLPGDVMPGNVMQRWKGLSDLLDTMRGVPECGGCRLGSTMSEKCFFRTFMAYAPAAGRSTCGYPRASTHLTPPELLFRGAEARNAFPMASGAPDHPRYDGLGRIDTRSSLDS